MKKILLAVAAVALLANGCNGQQSASLNTGENSGQMAEVSPAPTPEQASPPAQAQANVQVNNADDAVNLLEKDSANEQTQAAEKDDSDLTSSDSADLSSFTEVSNGY